MKPIFLLLGGNKLNMGIMQKFQKAGYSVYVVDWNEKPHLTGDKHYQIDVKDSEAILSALEKDGVLRNTVFAYSSIDLAVKSVAAINRALGLRTISDEGLRFSSSKSLMTERWNEVGILNRISKAYTFFDKEIISYNKKNKIIIKPDNSASSRGITILEKESNESDIAEAFNKALEEASDRIVMVEEFIEGTEFTVDMLGDDYGNVCVYGISRKTHTKNTHNNKIAVKLHYNAVSEDIQKRIAKTGIECYKALRFSASLGHLEVIMKDDGTISPVEIGARSSGFIASDLVDVVSGADYLRDLISVQKGMRVDEGLHHQAERSSVYFFYDFPENSIVKHECSLLDFCDKRISSRYYDRSNIKEGNSFSNIDNDNARLGFEVLEGPRDLLTIEYLKQAEQRMLQYMLEG